jgi:hypothetical protein
MMSWPIKVILIAVALVIIGGIVLHYQIQPPPKRRLADDTTVVSEKSDQPASRSPASRAQAVPAPDSKEQTATNEEASAMFFVSPEKIQKYLELHHRNAASLLAAFHATRDPENPDKGIDYLKEAATNFPGDPHVQWTVLAQNTFPEDRRNWLDAFKVSSPNNSLANYLSASDYFKNGQPDAAIKELTEATSKGQFADFAMENFLGGAELSKFGGASPSIANVMAMSAMSGDLLPELSSLKGITQGIRDVQKQYSDSGDTASVQNLSLMGVTLASRLTSGDGGRFVIGQLVGMATETLALQSLDQNTAYDFLGGESPSQRLEQLKDQRQDMRTLAKNFNLTFFNASEAERDNYTERMKIYGEVPAMRWFLQQHPPDSAQSHK